MDLNPVAILFRLTHVLSACVLIGSIYFFCFVLSNDSTEPSGAGSWRRKLKMTVHITLLLFLITGVYNALKNWPIYTRNPAIMHGMFGMHVLLGLAGITVLMMMLAGGEAKPARVVMARWALLLLILGAAAASTLKSAREWTVQHMNAAAAVQLDSAPVPR